MSALEETLAFQIRVTGLPEPVREFRFQLKRLWRFDFAWTKHKLCCEVHGATHTNGRHVRGVGFAMDREKMNAAQLEGWRVLEFTAEHIKSGYALATIEEALRAGN